MELIKVKIKKENIPLVRTILESYHDKKALLKDSDSETCDGESDYSIMFGDIVNNKHKKILELGCYKGYSTRILVLGAYLNNGHVWSVDLIDENIIDYLKKVKLDKYWTFIQADDIYLKWKRKVDMLFIDSSHGYVHTVFELNKYSPFAKKVIFLHDLSLEGVELAVNDFLSINKEFWKFTWYKTKLGLGKLTRIKKGCVPIKPRADYGLSGLGNWNRY